MSDPVSNVLNRAADRLEQPGVWAQGDDACAVERDCMATAIRLAASSYALFMVAVAATTTVIDDRTTLVEWNDVPGRTAAEVVTALRQAARTCP